MKTSPILAYLAGVFLLFMPALQAQHFTSKSRGLDSYRDLPDIFVQSISPRIAADYVYVKYVAADTFEVLCFLLPWMSARDTLFKENVLLNSGSQRLSVELYGLEEGWYQLYIYYQNHKIFTESLQILR